MSVVHSKQWEPRCGRGCRRKHLKCLTVPGWRCSPHRLATVWKSLTECLARLLAHVPCTRVALSDVCLLCACCPTCAHASLQSHQPGRRAEVSFCSNVSTIHHGVSMLSAGRVARTGQRSLGPLRPGVWPQLRIAGMPTPPLALCGPLDSARG